MQNFTHKLQQFAVRSIVHAIIVHAALLDILRAANRRIRYVTLVPLTAVSIHLDNSKLLIQIIIITRNNIMHIG